MYDIAFVLNIYGSYQIIQKKHLIKSELKITINDFSISWSTPFPWFNRSIKSSGLLIFIEPLVTMIKNKHRMWCKRKRAPERLLLEWLISDNNLKWSREVHLTVKCSTWSNFRKNLLKIDVVDMELGISKIYTDSSMTS